MWNRTTHLHESSVVPQFPSGNAGCLVAASEVYAFGTKTMSEFQSVQHGPQRLRPQSTFTVDGKSTSFTILDFWVWMGSDVLNNAFRGMVAEYIVGQATGAWNHAAVRVEWDQVDIRTPEGISIEVKSAAYIQSWRQPRPSRIDFRIAKTLSWDSVTGEYSETPIRSADVYVFCLLFHRDEMTINPLELTQWEFTVVPTKTLDEVLGDQKTVRLSRLRELGAAPVGYRQLRTAVLEAYGDGETN